MIPKLIETDEGPHHYCLTCEEYKPTGDFYPCNTCKSGYQYHCKECHKREWKIRRGNFSEISDEKAMEIILTRMGYDVNSEKTINEQFVERVFEKNGVDLNNLPISKRRRGKYSHLNPPSYASKEYYNWYNREIRRKKD